FASKVINNGNYNHEIVNSEYGRMLKLDITERTPDVKVSDKGTSERILPLVHVLASDKLGYAAQIISWQRHPTFQMIRLAPRYDVIPENTVERDLYIGPFNVSESVSVEEFRVPVKVISDSEDKVRFSLISSFSRRETVNFGYIRTESYGERFTFDGNTDQNWIFVSAEATSGYSVTGTGD
ncbi:MAG: hypothetical protein V1736_04385, partial [Pseudomonadota bacterium]